MKRKQFKQYLALFLVLCLCFTSVNLAGAATVKTVTVTNQKQLNAALKNKKVTKIRIKTKKNVKLNIPKKAATKKIVLVIDAPKATITNNATFKQIQLNGDTIKSFTEKGKQNTIVVNAPDAKVIVGKGAVTKTITIKSDSAAIQIKKGAKVETITTNKKNSEVKITANGEIGQVTVSSKGTQLTVTGKKEKIPVSVKAKDTKVTAETSVKLDLNQTAEVVLKKGAEKTEIKTNSEQVDVAIKNETNAAITITTPSGEVIIKKGESTPTIKPQKTTPSPSSDSTPAPTPNSGNNNNNNGGNDSDNGGDNGGNNDGDNGGDQEDLGASNILYTDEMEVLVDTKFPRVIQYTMKTKAENGKVFDGQQEELKYITINGVDVEPTITSKKDSKSKIVYTIAVKKAENNIDATLNAELAAEKNTLAFNITKITPNNGTIVKTIEIKNHNLVSVNSKQNDASLQGANMSTNAHKTGDREVLVNDKLDVKNEAKNGYMYAFVSNSDLSAGLWSNSENNVTADWQRVTATASETSGVKIVGLSSTVWTYQKDSQYREEDGSIELTDGSSVTIDELPSAKVAIAGDINGDNDIDWQDGAIAYRDIMNNPVGSEKVPSLVAYRICMNFGSQAQNPFLMTLDNVKKVYLHTDGLGQSILLKGYGSEGHDSGHLNYADIGTRIGGTKDMITLLREGKNYGATFGIHVNASETYPESKYFNEDILRKDSEGNYSYGWNWIDQGINIDADYDLRNGRADRWNDLYKELGGKENELDFIYVDVWGNGQSGDNGTWASRQLAKEITGLGWRLAGEWGHANEYDSTFQHWAADLTYGGYNSKGINSDIARFIRNHQKDSWIGNYTKYGGAAETPLLGGYNMRDFEGWQGRSDYADYIYTLFEVNLASKLVQHYTVNDWAAGEAVTMTDNGETYQYTPGMKAELVNADKTETLVIERKSNDFANDKDGYRTRTMTLNGKKIYEGQEGDTTYLIPWNWDESGNTLTGNDEKLYHWNTKGGSTTWEVPDGWTGNADVYKLTELGKEKVGTAAITNGNVTLTADAKTPYVIYKAGHKGVLKDVVWSEGMHIVDSGFNSGSLAPWNPEGTGVAITKSQGSNPMLTFTNSSNASVSQKLTGLTPNTKYAAYVGVDNRSDAKAGISITGATGQKLSTETGKSLAQNYVSAYAHNTGEAVATVNGTSYFQNMYVFFETGSDVSNVTLTLSREGGAGATYFDDVRICENNSENWTKEGSRTIFEQDFEKVAQGIYPFVVGSLEGITDNRTHLAEKHEPYTQRGWNGKAISDVIAGNWSVKTNGLTQRNKILYQTIPQNFTFKQGQTYLVRFDYEMGSEGTYTFVIGDGENNVIKQIPLEATTEITINGRVGAPKTFAYSLTSNSDATWVGLFSTDVPADTYRSTGAQATFESYNDVVLDNLVIAEISSGSDRTALYEIVKTARKEKPKAEFYTSLSWETLTKALAAAEEVLVTTEDKAQADITTVTNALTQAVEELEEKKITITDLNTLLERCNKHQKDNYSKKAWEEFTVTVNYAKSVLETDKDKIYVLTKAYQDLILAEQELVKDKGINIFKNGEISSFEIAAGSEQSDSGAEGPAKNTVDGNSSTIWHTSWDGTPLENRWIEFTFEEPQTVTGFKYLSRGNGHNGTILGYDIKVSTQKAGDNYTTAASGTWPKYEKEWDWQTVTFDKYYDNIMRVKLCPTETVGDYAAAAELRVLGIPKEDQAAPTGIIRTDGENASISALEDTMEYSTEIDGKYIQCPNGALAGLKIGDVYYIRFKETATHNASIPLKVVIYSTDGKTIPIKIALSPTELYLKQGETKAITATVTMSDGKTNNNVIWNSSDEKVATITDGTVTAITSGTTIITATAGAKTVTCAAIVGTNSDWENAAGNKADLNMLEKEGVHIKSSLSNDFGAAFINKKDKQYSDFKDGTVSITITPKSDDKNTRAGIFLRHNSTNKTGLFVGYDADGWFWQVYDGDKNPWYPGDRKAALTSNQSAILTVKVNGNKAEISLDNEVIFNNVDISTIPNAGGVALKVAYNSDIYFSNFTVSKNVTPIADPIDTILNTPIVDMTTDAAVDVVNPE